MKKLALVLLIGLSGCMSAAKEDLKNTLQETFQGAAVSMLSQAKWDKIASNLNGNIGPETVIELEGTVGQTAKATMRIHGATLHIDMSGHGTGGNEHEMELVQVMRSIVQRYGVESDKLTDAQIRQRDAEIALLLKLAAEKATSRPSQ